MSALPTIRIGHSPDPDDAFMFYGFQCGAVRIEGAHVAHVLHDIQTLNERSQTDDPLEVTALSLHALFGLGDRYEMLPVGTSVGRGYGPRLVTRDVAPLERLQGRRIALPGPTTTATLLARSLLPAFEECHMDFTRIPEAVKVGSVDAGVVIHEVQLTYDSHGLALCADLGALFSARTGGLPVPLGVNCVRRDLGPSLIRAIEVAYRRSVEYAICHRPKAVQYALEFARGIGHEVADTFVGMYVNEDSLDLRSDVLQAIRWLQAAYERTQTEASRSSVLTASA